MVAFYILGDRMTHTGEGAACRDEQILLAVSKNQNAISDIQQEGSDLVVSTNWRYWIALNLKRRMDIGMAAWCAVAHEGKGGMVRIKAGETEVGRVEKGKWASKFGE